MQSYVQDCWFVPLMSRLSYWSCRFNRRRISRSIMMSAFRSYEVTHDRSRISSCQRFSLNPPRMDLGTRPTATGRHQRRIHQERHIIAKDGGGLRSLPCPISVLEALAWHSSSRVLHVAQRPFPLGMLKGLKSTYYRCSGKIVDACFPTLLRSCHWGPG